MSFPEPHIHPPTTTHTHTVILLHGRGSFGPELAEELFSSKTTNNQNLPTTLPNVRWIFPTSRDHWDTKFEEDIPEWFDAYSLTNIEERQELQVEGLKESVKYVLEILKKEIELVGDAGKVFLGGMSMGMAVVMWVVVHYLASAAGKRKALGGVLGFSGWFPFARQIEEFFSTTGAGGPEFQRLILSLLGEPIPVGGDQDKETISPASIPICLLHGTDDAFVSVELGRQAAGVLQKMGVPVEWNEHTVAENEGHWIKESEGFDEILRFLQSRGVK
ncbi:alpha/beta hydrolase, partial [Aspergillus glaucus CBS 516.65]